MTDFDPPNSASIVSVTDKVRPVAVGAPVIAVHFLGDVAAFVGAEENVALVRASGDISRVAVHGGGILCVTSDGARIVTTARWSRSTRTARPRRSPPMQSGAG
jgi:hypothetical protein